MPSASTRTLAAALGATLLLAASAHAQAPVPGPPAFVPQKKALSSDGPTARYMLDGDWLYRADPTDQGRALGFPQQQDTAGWETRQVPNAFNAADYSLEGFLGGVSWYRKDFSLPPNASGVSWVVRFESINQRADVYLNGRPIGHHSGPYIPFEVPASLLFKDRPNRLVVRVDNRRGPTDIPPGGLLGNGSARGGWWNYGGILREVYLRRVDHVDIADVYARPFLPCRRCAATVRVSATLRNFSVHKLDKLRVGGNVGPAKLDFGKVSLPGHGARRITATAKLAHPSLWEPGHPALYRTQIAAARGSKALAVYRLHVGVRSIRVDQSGHVLLNGRRISLRGASVHEDNPVVGAALNPAQIDDTVKLLQQLGATMTRAQYPLHPRLIEDLDRAGIMLWEQIPFYRMPTRALASGFVRGKGLAFLRDMIRRDRNHPSVLTWSVSNELPTQITPGQERYLTDAAALAHSEDPSRLVAFDFTGYPSLPPEEVYKRFDAIGANAYYGWYHGPNGQTEDRDLLGPYLDQLHEYYPHQALFVTEFGAEANRDGPPDEKGTYAFQTGLLQSNLRTDARKPFLNGAVVWLLRDFAVRPGWDGGNPHPSPPVNAKGLVDQYGQKKPAFGAVAAMFAQVKALR